ncbi:YjcZ family sporulation protein [Ureibacillus sp. FSL K6-8385]|uniref:YjcZ family sporulation protein n=1 Tax=Ureibacillus terrenus TaxID=118246 RepID=A0A540V403_9BACL|nr:YjcZ family sporulation protein [Ureibacillus terrenus]MED3661844.1 YjcZ family sporulation protein [Ureibacillus terrenus]MED3763147.1 YjcZ family sporulation protein [Ureibacillus terrenus]TQE91469.1 YjcZ family sporulation protein [Ureibacillus terrenus]
MYTLPAYDYCAPSYVSPAYYRGKWKYNGDLFVLIVVLFILLIIVGSCKW